MQRKEEQKMSAGRSRVVLWLVLAGLGCLWAGTAMAGEFEWNWDSLRDEWEKGGNTMWWLLALSIAGVAFALERCARLRRGKVVPKGFRRTINEMWKAGKVEEIGQACDKSNSVMARIVAYMVRHRKRAFPDVSAGAGEIAVREFRPHYRRIYPLLVVGTLAPLMGLFGTVVGLMEAFENFRLLGETGDPSVFAGSISKALITTIVGLAIAMPMLAAYHYFKTRTNALSDLLEAEVSGLMDEWFAPKEAGDDR
jgi:biopolymer transport protein ExbB